jgi:hypothetical protein
VRQHLHLTIRQLRAEKDNVCIAHPVVFMEEFLTKVPRLVGGNVPTHQHVLDFAFHLVLCPRVRRLDWKMSIRILRDALDFIIDRSGNFPELSGVQGGHSSANSKTRNPVEVASRLRSARRRQGPTPKKTQNTKTCLETEEREELIRLCGDDDDGDGHCNDDEDFAEP